MLGVSGPIPFPDFPDIFSKLADWFVSGGVWWVLLVGALGVVVARAYRRA